MSEPSLYEPLRIRALTDHLRVALDQVAELEAMVDKVGRWAAAQDAHPDLHALHAIIDAADNSALLAERGAAHLAGLHDAVHAVAGSVGDVAAEAGEDASYWYERGVSDAARRIETLIRMEAPSA